MARFQAPLRLSCVLAALGIVSGYILQNYEKLLLYHCFEPCPMCLTPIINAGIRKTFYAAPDPPGGMCNKIGDLPSFWIDVAPDRIYGPAACSPALKDMAIQLFGHYANRNIRDKR